MIYFGNTPVGASFFSEIPTHTADYAFYAGTASYALLSNTADYASFSGTSNYSLLSNTADFALLSGTADFALLSGTADFALLSDTASYALYSGTALNALNASTANYAVYAGTAIWAIQANCAVYAGTAAYALNSNCAVQATYAASAGYANISGTAAFAQGAGYTSGTLTIVDTVFNGSEDVNISIKDLGLTSTMTFLGVTDTTAVYNESTTNYIHLIGGNSTTAETGNVVLSKQTGLEYLWSDDMWQELGLATSYALAQHTHGNINSNGTISTTATIVNGTSLAIVDTNGELNKASLSFDGSSNNLVLAKSGTWVNSGNLSFTITLNSTSWSNSALTVSDNRFVSTGYAYIVTPASSSFNDYTNSIIYADDITTNNEITFHCKETPENNLTVNVLRMVSS